MLRWQAILTGVAAVLGAYFAGKHGVISALVGGGISMAAAVLFASIASVRRGISADDVLITAFKAEGAKLVFIVIALWLVMASYKNVVHVFLIGTFIATVLVSSMAFFVGDKRN